MELNKNTCIHHIKWELEFFNGNQDIIYYWNHISIYQLVCMLFYGHSLVPLMVQWGLGLVVYHPVRVTQVLLQALHRLLLPWLDLPGNKVIIDTHYLSIVTIISHLWRYGKRNILHQTMRQLTVRHNLGIIDICCDPRFCSQSACKISGLHLAKNKPCHSSRQVGDIRVGRDTISKSK